MKHSIKSKKKIDIHNMLVSVELLPENDNEKKAIKNIEALSATDEERTLIENYLHFSLGLGDYSILKSLNQTGNIFNLQVFV